MDVKSIRKIYGLPESTTARSVINHAIRRSIPGGDEVMQVLSLLSTMPKNRASRGKNLEQMRNLLIKARNKMAQVVLAESPPEQSVFDQQVFELVEDPSGPPESPIPLEILGKQTDSKIAREYGISHTWVRKIRERHGIKPCIAKARIRWQDWDAIILQKDREGMGSEEIAKIVGCHRASVIDRLRKLKK